MTEIKLYHAELGWFFETEKGEMACPPHVKTIADLEVYFPSDKYTLSFPAGVPKKVGPTKYYMRRALDEI